MADTQVLPEWTRNGQRQEPRRLHGLRFPVLPNGPWLAQVGGAIAATVGAYMQWGVAATLIAGGAAAVVLGMLKEDNRI